jgi:hypothetical protein
LRTLEDWSTYFSWQSRIAEIDRKTREEAERDHLKWVKQHHERLRREGLQLQRRGMKWLKQKGTDEVKAHEAIRAIELGFKLEALALGQATQRIAVEDSDERVQRLTNDELALIIRRVREALRGRTPGESEQIPG